MELKCSRSSDLNIDYLVRSSDYQSPGRMGSYFQTMNPSVHLQLQPPGTKTVLPRVDNAPHGVNTPIF